jgi:hypothetical protein
MIISPQIRLLICQIEGEGSLKNSETYLEEILGPGNTRFFASYDGISQQALGRPAIGEYL